MRPFVLLPFLASAFSAVALGEKILATLLTNADDAEVPDYTQDELNVAHRISVDITDLTDLVAYKSKLFLSDCKKVERRVLVPPPNHVFKTILADGKMVYEPTKFLGYKVVIDSVKEVPTYVRVDGFLRQGVVASRYLYRNEKGWDLYPRRNFIHKRVTDGNIFEIDLYSNDHSWKNNMIVREVTWSHGPMTVMYPKFNKYVMGVAAGPREMWNYDSVKADLVLKMLLYSYKGNNYCVLTVLDWNGTSQDIMYIEDNYGYSHVSHTPQRHLGRTSGFGTRRRPGEYRDPEVLDIKPPTPKHTPYGVVTDANSIRFLRSKLVQVNFRRNPHPLVEEGWTLDVRGYPNGDYERVFKAKDGFLIYRLVDHDRLVWDTPGYAIKNGYHLITNDGMQFLRLEVIHEHGQTYEYHFQKVNGEWRQIEKYVWDIRTNTRLNYLLFGSDAIIEGKDLNEEEVTDLNAYTKVDLDINKEVYHAWSTDRITIHGVITRKVYTAVPGFAMRNLTEDGEVFFSTSENYLINKVVHYKVFGMELVTFLAHDTVTGKHSIHYLMRNRGKWIDVNEISYSQNLAIVLNLVRKWTLSKHEGTPEMFIPADIVPYIPVTDPYVQPQEALNIPLDPVIDAHQGGLVLPLPPNQDVLDRVAETEGIRLELRGYRDERYNIIAMSTGEKYFRVIYRPADGFHFNSVIENGRPVFTLPGFVVTEVALDETPDKEYFLQINAYDSTGKQYVFYYYKTHNYNPFQEISRKTYNNIRHRSIIQTEVDIGKPKASNKNVVKLISKHFENVVSYLPRINVIIQKIKHGKATVWQYDDRSPEIVTRVVTFTRQGVRGCLIHYIDEDANETEKLFLNTNPKTNQYVKFIHKGEMFSMFKNYLQNRKTGFAWNMRYLPDEINWTEVVEPGTPEYEMCQKGKKIQPNGEKCQEVAEEEVLSDDADEAEDDVIDLTNDMTKEDSAKAQPAAAFEQETEEEMTDEQKQIRDAVAARKQHRTYIEDNIYYSDKKFAMQQVIHKEGKVWDSQTAGSNQLCLDVRKYRRGQYRLIQCEIMSPNGQVEIRYFMNTHNGRGDYREISVSEFGSDI